MDKISVVAEENLIKRLRKENPQVEELSNRLIPAIDKVLTSGRG